MRLPLVTFFTSIALVSSGMSASIISGYEITGSTTSLVLTAGNIADNLNNNTALSNSGSHLVINFSDPNPDSSIAGDSDFYLTWQGPGDGLNFSTTTYTYCQIDIISTSAGITSGNWQLFFQDNDSTIGGGSNSGQNIGTVTANGGGAFSVLIDLTDGGTNTSGAPGWGPGTLDAFRLDVFNTTSVFGESMTISEIKFGSTIAAVPEPTYSLFLAVTCLLLLRRRR